MTEKLFPELCMAYLQNNMVTLNKDKEISTNVIFNKKGRNYETQGIKPRPADHIYNPGILITGAL